jgi:O-antigen/teichoic acid export membrane protein
LANFPFENIAGVVYRVSFPAFSKLQNDLNRLREAFLGMTKLLSLISFPLFTGLMTMANELIPIIFGEKWIRAIVPLQIITGVALITSFVSPCGQIILTLGRPEIEFKFNLIQVPLLLIGIFIGVKHGIIGVAIAMSLVIGVMGFVFLKLSINLINLSLKGILEALSPALLSSLPMLVLMSALRYLLTSLGYKDYQILLICVPFGAAIYFLALLTFFRSSFQMLWVMFMDLLGNHLIFIRRSRMFPHSST